MASRKLAAGVGLALVAALIVIALLSFWQENWSALQSPGVVEGTLARLLLSGSRQAVSETPNPVAPTAANLAEGGQLFQKQCAFCHGDDGTGQGPTGAQFYPPVPSLVDANRRLTEAQMQAVIRQGVRYTAMPSFSKALSEEQCWKIVAWVRRLPASATSGTGAAPAPAPLQ